MTFDRVLKMPTVLNKPEFWIWHGCIRKGYTVFRIGLITALYASIIPEYALMSLNMPEHGWILLKGYIVIKITHILIAHNISIKNCLNLG